MKNYTGLNSARGLFIFIPPFISQILDFIYWTVWIFILIYFEWRDIIKDQQLTNQLLQI